MSSAVDPNLKLEVVFSRQRMGLRFHCLNGKIHIVHVEKSMIPESANVITPQGAEHFDLSGQISPDAIFNDVVFFQPTTSSVAAASSLEIVKPELEKQHKERKSELRATSPRQFNHILHSFPSNPSEDGAIGCLNPFDLDSEMPFTPEASTMPVQLEFLEVIMLAYTTCRNILFHHILSIRLFYHARSHFILKKFSVRRNPKE